MIANKLSKLQCTIPICFARVSGKFTTFQLSKSYLVCLPKSPLKCPNFHQPLPIIEGSRQYSQNASSDSPDVDPELVKFLKRTSLVDFDDDKIIKQMKDSMDFVKKLEEVDTEGVEPMISPLDPLEGEIEVHELYLRSDEPVETSKEAILRNASITEEDYFVAPPGNIPLKQ